MTNQVYTKVRQMLSCTLSVLYKPQDLQWSYSHHASICNFAGQYHAIWSNGKRDEDDLRQRVLHAVSHDGVHWSRHEVLFPSETDHVMTAAGFHIHDGMLVAYAGSYAYAPQNVACGRYITINDQHRGTTLLAKSTSDGAAWGPVIDLHIPVVPNHGPQKLHSGRLLLSGGITFPYTDDPFGLGGWNVRGLDPCPWTDMCDDSEGVMRHAALRDDGVMLCEGSFYQTDDRAIHMLLRSDKRRLYESVSIDDGETWSKPIATGFICANSKFHLGRLPDGRFYWVGNPDPASARCPLVLSLSADGAVFDQEYIIDETYRPLRHPGKYKGGIYGYPHSYIEGGRMYIICSVNKEDVHVYSFELSQLDH